MAIAVGSLGLVVAALVATGNDPVAWTTDTWKRLTGSPRQVGAVEAAAVPPESVFAPFKASSLTDGDTRTAWATPWPQGTGPAPKCASASPATGLIRLTWSEPVRLSRIEVNAGLAEKEAGSSNQFTPQQIDLRFGDQCVRLPVKRSPDAQTLKIETAAEVDTITVSISSVYPNRATPLVPVVAISEIKLFADP